MLTEPVAVALLVTDALDALKVPYFITGSLGSAVHGVVRTTLDIDLVAELRPEHGEPLIQRLGPQFYADIEAIGDAIRRRSSFNLIHQETMLKVDIFMPDPRPFKEAQFERRVREVVATDPERTAFITSAEDIVLAKLEWYRRGGEVSERQWRDVLGVLKVQAGRLDLPYLRKWAINLEVGDLLDRALSQAGQEGRGDDRP